MDFPFNTVLRNNLSLVDESEWDSAVGEAALAEMKTCARMKLPVIVLGLETGTGDTPEQFYYNVKLPSGKIVDGLSGFHLLDINQLAADQISKIADAKITLGCQYIVELTVSEYTWGETLDHGMMENAIKQAVADMLKHKQFAGHKTTVNSATYETEYEVDN